MASALASEGRFAGLHTAPRKCLAHAAPPSAGLPERLSAPNALATCSFGNLANLAARMEQTSEGGCVHMTEAVWNALRAELRDSLVIEERRNVELKNIGVLPRSFLLRRQPLAVPWPLMVPPSE